MLLELRAENYAVIDRAQVNFDHGLNLLTGETGAGKSILVDALALLLGGKASSDAIRHGSDKATISCIFESTPGALDVLDRNGIDADSGSDGVLLRREILTGGKGRVFINNQPATVAVLRQLAPELALIHAQGDTLGSFDQAQQRSLLDRFAGLSTEGAAAAFVSWRDVSARLEELTSSEQDRLRMADLWRFQSREIEDAAITGEDEDAQLEAEKRILANAEKLFTAAMSAHDLLYESEHSAVSSLGAALKLVEELARYEPRFAEPVQQLAAARAVVEDLSAGVRDFAENVQSGPERLAEIEDRLALLDRLKRKYGRSLAEVVAFGAESARQLAEVENRDALIEGLRAQERASAARFREQAAELTRKREAAAKKLAQQAQQQINDLAMKVRFEVHVTARTEPAHWSAAGWDQLDFRIATNAGEPLKPLEEIASGGEMSRVMLALKVTVEEAAAGRGGRRTALPRTLVFDEIDIGIGGRAAEAVGRKLKSLARTQQVICITHLPQIAAFGDQHYLIEKSDSGGRTRTGISRMEPEQRVREVARMLSGATLSETSLQHARSLIENASA